MFLSHSPDFTVGFLAVQLYSEFVVEVSVASQGYLPVSGVHFIDNIQATRGIHEQTRLYSRQVELTPATDTYSLPSLHTQIS